MSTPTPAPDNSTTEPPPLTVSAPQPDTPSSTPPAPDSVPSPVSTSPPPPDTRSPSSDSDSTSPPSPALAPPPDTELPPPAFASPPPPASAAPPENQLPPPPTAPAPPTPAVSPPPPPSTSSPSPPPPSTSSPSPPPPSTSSPPPSSDSSPPPSTSSPPATSASPPPPSSSPPTSSASPPPPSTSSPPSSSASPPPPTSSPPSSSASPPPPSTSSPPSSSASPPPPSTSSPSTAASPPPLTSPPPSASPPPPSTFPSSPSTSPPPPSTSSPPTSSSSPTTPPSTSSPPTSSASPTTPPLTSSPPTSSASPTPPPSASSPPTSSASSTPTPSSLSPPSSSAFPPPPPSTSSTSPSLLLSPSPLLNSGSTPVDSSSSGISVAVVAGMAIGGVAILLVLILLFVCYRKKRRNHDAEAFHAQPPFAGYKDVPYGGPLPGPIMRLMSNASAHSPGNAYAPPFLLPSFNSTGSRHSGHETPPRSVLGSSKRSFSYEELALATNGFSEANLLGQGGFGYVHRGVLPNGKEVAIKQLKAGSGQGEREFQAEVEIISRVHHKHLVSLVGYCITGPQRLLVYEYIPNNNLEFHLHEKGRPTMDWSARVRIALGSAKGLSYLHEDCNPKIIHRDIKAANILLDFKFEAKVADFGLAKFTLDIQTHVSTRVMGTFGYLAPEYASSGKLSEKSDVFSFGVVLLELITGHKPVDTTQTFMEDSLVDWARPLLVRAIEDENYDGLVDPKLQGNFIPTEMARMVACAAACVCHSAKRRPRMIQVVRALEGDATLADLNKEVRPGPSTACDESSDYDTTQYKEDMKKFRKMALESREYGATGVAYSAGTSEYGLYPSSSSSSDAQTSREMEMKRWRNESLGLS